MRAVMLVVLAGSMMACGGGGDGSDGGSTTTGSGGAFCQKMQTCNVLRGVSMAECNALVDGCMKQLLPAQRQDWNTNMNQCLQMQSCGNFVDCWSTVPGC
jgi:hypothetical protein